MPFEGLLVHINLLHNEAPRLRDSACSPGIWLLIRGIVDVGIELPTNKLGRYFGRKVCRGENMSHLEVIWFCVVGEPSGLGCINT